MARVYLGLGSNIEPEKNLRLGVGELRRLYGELDISPVYLCPAIGFSGEPFLNFVVGLDTDEDPHTIHDRIERIHSLAGRKRGKHRNQSRTLDIDLLLYDDLVLDEQGLHLPRSDVLDYAFVLRPLAELAPTLEHPQTGRTMAEHWRRAGMEDEALEAVTISF